VVSGFVSCYWYDAGGERVVNESGYDEGIYANSTFSGGLAGNDNKNKSNYSRNHKQGN